MASHYFLKLTRRVTATRPGLVRPRQPITEAFEQFDRITAGGKIDPAIATPGAKNLMAIAGGLPLGEQCRCLQRDESRHEIS